MNKQLHNQRNQHPAERQSVNEWFVYRHRNPVTFLVHANPIVVTQLHSFSNDGPRERERDRATEREGHSASLSVCFWSFSTTATAATAAAASHRTVSSYSSTPPFLTCIMARYVYMYICVCVDVWLTGSESVSARLCVCESVSLAVALAVVVPCRAAVVLVFRVVHGVFRKNRGRSTKTPKSRSNDHMRVLHTPISDKEISSIHSTKSKSHSTALHCIGPHCIRLD